MSEIFSLSLTLRDEVRKTVAVHAAAHAFCDKEPSGVFSVTQKSALVLRAKHLRCACADGCCCAAARKSAPRSS
eukprot:3064378-Rhodomonas_salina.1